jgi:hypothetical protein
MPEQDVLDSINVVKIVAAVTLVGVLVLLYKAMDDAGMYGKSSGDGFKNGSLLSTMHTQRSDSGYSSTENVASSMPGGYYTAEGFDVGPQFWGPSASDQRQAEARAVYVDYTGSTEKYGKLLHPGQNASEGMNSERSIARIAAMEGMVTPMTEHNLLTSMQGN